MIYYKGLPVALAALRDVPGKLLIIGTGPLEAELKAKAAELGVADRVIFQGHASADQLAGAYRAATALWFPSSARSEGFGLVQVEAMASGCPIINTAIAGSGVPWVCRHEQEGLTVPVNDPAALAAAANRLLAEPGLREKLVAGGQARAAAEFDHRVMAERSLAIYREVIRRCAVKVLHLAAGNLFGGIETYLLTLARLRHLCPEMEPHFGLCFPGRLRDELLATGVPVHDLGAVRVSRPWTVLRGRLKLKRVLEEHNFTAVVTHACWPHAIFGPVVRRRQVRLANLVHDELKGTHWIDRWAARTPPDLVIANSRFTMPPFVKRVFPEVPVEVIYYPFATTHVDPTVRTELRASLNTSKSDVVILQASRLERWKGQAVHLAALSKLANIPGWVAWIAGGSQKAGEDQYDKEMKAVAVSAGISDRVRFLGQRSDVPRLMAAADIFCQPNTGPEPFGIVFVEALSAKLPVVTSNFGGGMEIVTDRCGILCPPRNVEAVADALQGLIADPIRRRTLAEAGPARAGELCEPGRQMARLARAVANLDGVLT